MEKQNWKGIVKNWGIHLKCLTAKNSRSRFLVSQNHTVAIWTLSVQKALDLTTLAKSRRKMRIIDLNFLIKKGITLTCRLNWNAPSKSSHTQPDFSWNVNVQIPTVWKWMIRSYYCMYWWGVKVCPSFGPKNRFQDL